MTTEIFFFKNHAENETRRLVRDLFLFFKIALYEVFIWKQMVCSLVSITFHSPQLAKQLKQNIWNLIILIQRYVRFWFLRKEPGNSFSTTFCVWLFKKNISHVMLYWLTKFLYLIAFIAWDIGIYVYCNCLLTKLWHHRVLKLTWSF